MDSCSFPFARKANALPTAVSVYKLTKRQDARPLPEASSGTHTLAAQGGGELLGAWFLFLGVPSKFHAK